MGFMPIASTELFSALADPTRRAIFERLPRDGEQRAGMLTGHAGVSQPAVSKHLAVLKLDFSIYPTFVAHATLAALLAGFIVLHVLAALFHQGVLKDGLLRRMLFGRRGPISAALPDNRPKQRTAAR
jgi:DNA-binding transcriptional ArsR family regulator